MQGQDFSGKAKISIFVACLIMLVIYGTCIFLAYHFGIRVIP